MKATVNWEEVENDMVAYLSGSSVGDWEDDFRPLMAALINEQSRLWALLLGIDFEVRNLDAESWFGNYVLKFARDCTQTTEGLVKTVVGQGMAEGWSIPTMQDNLGMLFDQMMYGDLTPAEFEWMSERMPAHRREMIARTETIRASNKGNEQQFARWGVEGKEWLTADDDRLCPWCAAMDGKVINVTEPFFLQGDVFEVEVGDRVAGLALNYEDVSGPPLHPNCRCTLLPWKQEWAEFGLEVPALVEDWLAASEAVSR